jgi:hypothetical protein
MIPKKLCSLGILDIELNLILNQSLAEKNHFNIDEYDDVRQLKELFYPSEEKHLEINYFNHLYLSSKNNLINILLSINRAYKSKTFIEFIMPNKLDFSENTRFVKSLLKDVFNQNYLFIIENKMIDIPSKIIFYIKIVDDKTNEVINYKYFDLFEINEMDIDLSGSQINKNESGKNLIYNSIKNRLKVNYYFSNCNYFLIDLLSFKQILWKNKFNMLDVIHEVINNNKDIIIILFIDDQCFKGVELNKLIKIYKDILEISDIIFCNQYELNNYFKTYNETMNINITKQLPHAIKSKLNKNIDEFDFDYILLDMDKQRKNVPRISILYDNFESLVVYVQQGMMMDVEYYDTFYFKSNVMKLDLNLNYKENKGLLCHFIGGFLSRLIYNKSFRVCFYAGLLILNKINKNNNKKKLFLHMDDYNVLVPNEKKSLKEKLDIINEKMNFLKLEKEKGFVLDCTNINKCKYKLYNPLLDDNCASYLLTKNNFEHLQKIGFINKNGFILKDPDKFQLNKNK